MTECRRLMSVAAVLVLAAVVSFSHVWGEPARDRNAGAARPAAHEAVPPGTDREILEDLAASKFADRPIVTYKTKAGDTLFALQVKPKLDAAPARPRDVAILIDTSASQARGALASAIKLTEAITHALGADDRVSIYTVNTTTRNLTRGWKAAAAVQDALKALKEEYASGATNLKVGLQTAVKNFESRAGRQQLILFLGDGMSILNPITARERAELSGDMVRSEIAFFPVPLGTRLDPATLHGLAGSTGGAPVRMLPGDKPEAVVKRFLDVVSLPILYPAAVKWQGEVQETFPARLPPLRGDSPTLVLGRLKAGDKIGYKVTGTVAGKEVVAEQQETLSTPEIDNFFLVGMLAQWREARDAPALIRADRALAFADQENRLARLELVARAEWALAENQHEAALRLFAQVQQLNPDDGDAKAGIAIVKKVKDGVITIDKLRASLQPKPGDAIIKVGKDADGKMRHERLVLLAQAGGAGGAGAAQNPPGGGAGGGGVAGPNPLAPAEGPKDILRENLERQAVEEQRINRVVDDALAQAARLLRDGNPEAAHDLVKRTLDGIRDNPDLGFRTRGRLADRLVASLRNVDVQGVRIVLDREERAQRMAVGIALETRLSQLLTADERTRQRVRRFHELMDQARAQEDEIERTRRVEEALEIPQEIHREYLSQGIPTPPAVSASYIIGQANHHLQEIRELRRLREERFLLAMLGVERSHVPFPDEPPIRFPPRATWKALYQERKIDKRYDSAPLGGNSEEERRISRKARELEKKLTLPIDFPSKGDENLIDQKTTLGELLDVLGDRYDITFTVNEPAFKEAAGGMDFNVMEQKVLEKAFPKMIKVSLSSVLQQILSRIPLTNNDFATFIIRREAVEITTGDRARKETVTRVAYVADLVYPILDNGQVIPTSPYSFNSQAIFGGFGFAGGFGLPGGGFPGGAGGFPGGGFPGGGFPGAGGFPGGGFPGGGFGMPGGGFGGFQAPGQQGPSAGGAQQSFLLVKLIKQTIGTPKDWAPVVDPNAPAFQPGQPNPNDDPNSTPGGWDIGYYPPARSFLIKAPSRIHINLPPIAPSGGPPAMGALDREPRNFAAIGPKDKDADDLLQKAKETRVAGLGGHRDDKNKKGYRPPLEDADPAVIWKEALAKGIDDPGLIIATADYMVQCGKWSHCAEFLKANLRQGIVVEPWVYESLALALRESQGSSEEIERAELALSDLEPLDARGFLKASQVMAEKKGYSNALAFCRQAATLDPDSPQAYADALNYAQQASDVEGMEWAAGNLLKRDWTADNQTLHARAKEKLSELAKTVAGKDTDAAGRLQAVLQKQRERDLVLRLTWQGEASLDVKVEEPTGSICSWLNRQTIGGGTLMDTLTEKVQTYAAAQAFSGTYKVTVDTAWGKPLGNKARVDVILHQGTKDELVKPVTVDLGRSNTFTVKLDDGRRTALAYVPPQPRTPEATPDSTAQVGSSAGVLSKLQALREPGGRLPEQGLRGLTGGAGVSTRPGVTLKASERGKGDQVVYQSRVEPFVTNTAQVSTQAVISADRRWVRIGLSPVFLNSVTGTQMQGFSTPVIPGGGNVP